MGVWYEQRQLLGTIVFFPRQIYCYCSLAVRELSLGWYVVMSASRSIGFSGTAFISWQDLFYRPSYYPWVPSVPIHSPMVADWWSASALVKTRSGHLRWPFADFFTHLTTNEELLPIAGSILLSRRKSPWCSRNVSLNFQTKCKNSESKSHEV